MVGAGGGNECLRILSPREREIALLVARGMTNKQIARELGLTPGTVAQHLHRTFLKLKQFLTPGAPEREMLTLLMSDSQARKSGERQRAGRKTRRASQRTG
jgi:FixJ family two-component response regulator